MDIKQLFKGGLNDADEHKAIAEIFIRAGIDFIEDVKNLTTFDVDIVGIHENILILVSCFGSASSIHPKLQISTGYFDFIEKNPKIFFKQIKLQHLNFYKKHKIANNTKIKFYRLGVISQKDSFESLTDLKREARNKKIVLWSREDLIYFTKISNATFDHSKYEIFSNLKINPKDIIGSTPSQLAFIANGIKISGFHILNITIPVKTLLKYSSINRLRNVSTEEGYQRLLEEKKLGNMREYLLRKDSIYPSNLICMVEHNNAHISVPKKIELQESDKVDSLAIDRQSDENLFFIRFRDIYNLFEIIDGQHRLYSYAQTEYSKFRNFKNPKLKKGDKKLQKISDKHKLTVTIIVFKKHNPKKAAELFYEINTKQTKISPEDIIDILERYYKNDPVAHANKLLRALNKENTYGLEGKIKFKFWESDKIKRTSLINHSGLKTLFNDKKPKPFSAFKNAYGLISSEINNYDDFCLILINNFLISAFKSISQEYPKDFKAMRNDVSLKNYYAFSAVFIGALIRLSRHFLVKKSTFFKPETFFKSFKTGKNNLKLNINNLALQKTFEKGLNVVAKKFKFTTKEFDDNAWKSNSWAQIEAKLFKTIKKKYKKFGDINLINKKYR